MSWPNTFLQGRAAAVGFNVMGSIGGLSPFVIGFMANHGSYIDSMYLLGSFVLAAALMILGGRPEPQLFMQALDYTCSHACIEGGCAWGRSIPGGQALCTGQRGSRGGAGGSVFEEDFCEMLRRSPAGARLEPVQAVQAIEV